MPDRRHVLKTVAGLFLAALGSGSYAFAWEPVRHRVTHYRVSPHDWPARRGLRIALLTDLHCGPPHMPLARLEGIVAETNALKPDLVLLLGDFVASRLPLPDDPRPDEWAAVLAKLTARDGVHAVLGNHDWWEDEEAQANRRGPPAASRALKAAGIPVLENRAVRLSTAAGPLWLAGLGDQMAFLPPAGLTRGRRRAVGIDDLPATLAQIPDDGVPAILMAHEPDVFARRSQRFALTVCGHTHGGQVRLFGWSPVVPSRYGNRYAYGHVREHGRDLVVSAGLGTSRFPLRFGMPPEIVLVELGPGGAV